MSKKILLLPGDGVGPEVLNAGKIVLEKVANVYGHHFNYEQELIGAAAIEQTGDPFPAKTEEACKQADAILFGAIGDPKYDNDPSAKVRPEQGLLRMRKNLGLFANIRPIKIYPNLRGRSPLRPDLLEGVDFLVVRELTGGIYFGEPRGRSEDGTKAFETATYSKEEIVRVARVAFEFAQTRRKHVTLIDKANVLVTSRLWREVVNEVALDYTDVKLEAVFVDNAAMQIIKRPAYFDVILTDNMFGDILTDEASVLSSSIGLLPSASLGGKVALYEPIHGAYNKATGTGTANPVGSIMSVAMMLRHSFNMIQEAEAIERAVEKVIAQGIGTRDIAPNNPVDTITMARTIAETI